MSLVKLAWNVAAGLEAGAKKIGLSGIAKTIAAHPHAASSIALTGGIGLAEAGTEAAFAKPGERLNAAKTGLKKGLLYGGILSGAEYGIQKGIFSAAGKKY